MGLKSMALVTEFLVVPKAINFFSCIALPPRLSMKDSKLVPFPNVIYKQGVIKKSSVFQSLVYHIVRKYYI